MNRSFPKISEVPKKIAEAFGMNLISRASPFEIDEFRLSGVICTVFPFLALVEVTNFFRKWIISGLIAQICS